MKLSTKGRYAMIALTDLAAQGPDRLVSPERDRRAAGHQPRLSRAAVRQAAPRRDRRLGARPGRRLPAGAAGRADPHLGDPRGGRRDDGRAGARRRRAAAAPAAPASRGSPTSSGSSSRPTSTSCCTRPGSATWSATSSRPARRCRPSWRWSTRRHGPGGSVSRPRLSRLERRRAAAAGGAGGDGGGDGRGRQPVVRARRGPGGAGDRRAGAGAGGGGHRLRAPARWSSPRARPRRRRWRWPGAGCGAAPVEHDCVAAWTEPALPVDGDGRVTVAIRRRACCRRRTRRPGCCRSCRRGSPASTRRRRSGGCPSPSTGRARAAALVSAHKLGGPKGVGALLLAPGVEVRAACCAAAGRSSAGGPGPRTWSASPASARRPRRRRPISPPACGTGWRKLEIF